MLRALALLAFAAGAAAADLAAADLAVKSSPRAVLGQQPAAGGGTGGGALAATLGSGSIAAVAPGAAGDAAAVAIAAIDAAGHATALPGAAIAQAAEHALLDYTGKPLGGALGTRCQQAVSELLARDAAGEAPPVHASALDGLSVAPTNETHGVRIVYFIGIGGRPSAMLIVQASREWRVALARKKQQRHAAEWRVARGESLVGHKKQQRYAAEDAAGDAPSQPRDAPPLPRDAPSLFALPVACCFFCAARAPGSKAFASEAASLLGHAHLNVLPERVARQQTPC